MEGVTGRPRRGTVVSEVWRVRNRSKVMNRRERIALGKKAEQENNSKISGGVKGRYLNEKYLHGQKDYAN